MNTFKDHFEPFLALFFPEVCVHCQHSLLKAEKYLCSACRADLPLVPQLSEESHRLLQRFIIPNPPDQVLTFLRFYKDGISQSILHALKYQGMKDLGVVIGRWFGTYLLEQNVWLGADVIVPVPLHRSKFSKRGYNQSMQIAQGMAEVLNTTASDDCLERTSASDSQTRKNRLERWQNVENIFCVKDEAAIRGKQVLILDDVLTTGATLEACILALQTAGAAKINAAVLAAAQN
jgi:ComF family protein